MGILSEWIGTFLIHEAMTDSVIYARDRWLAPGGFIMPDRATLYLAGAEDQGLDLAAWKNFHGLDFSLLGEAWRSVGVQQCAFRNSLATEPVVLLQLNLYNSTPQDAEFTHALHLAASGEEAKEVHALMGWFTLGFLNFRESYLAFLLSMLPSWIHILMSSAHIGNRHFFTWGRLCP